jgi:hypothetical protein
MFGQIVMVRARSLGKCESLHWNLWLNQLVKCGKFKLLPEVNLYIS